MNSLWEYKIINDWEHGNPNSEEELSTLGEESWELVCIDQTPLYGSGQHPDTVGHTKQLGIGRSWYFKRLKSPTP